MKAINSEALPIVGVSKRVPLKFAVWSGEMDIVVARMDDFDVVLGMDFQLEHKVIPMPLVDYQLQPIVVPARIKQSANLRMISAIQLKR